MPQRTGSSMSNAKNGEPPQAEVAGAPRRSKSGGEAQERSNSNPVWQRLATRVQAKLNVTSPGDPYEREAERIADGVMRAPEQQAEPARASEEDETVAPPLE